MHTDYAAKHIEEITALLELSGENSFKIRAYENAARELKLANINLDTFIQKAENKEIKGFGKDLLTIMVELKSTGRIQLLETLRKDIPTGLIELMAIKGLGGKKIKLIRDTLGINDLQELKKSCEDGTICQVKGFGEKTSQGLLSAIEFYISHKGMLRLSGLDEILSAIESNNSNETPVTLLPIGEAARKCEVIKKIELVGLSTQRIEISALLASIDAKATSCENPAKLKFELGTQNVKIDIRLTNENDFPKTIFRKTANPAHLHYLSSGSSYEKLLENFSSETEFYSSLGLPVFPPEMREGIVETDFLELHPELNKAGLLLEKKLVATSDLKGALHIHSTYSDGKNTIEEMARASISRGLAYMGISDHSKSAAYAGGLYEDKIKRQHEEIDKLNELLHPFVILKGIESDILKNGDLDYPEEILARFDFVIASVHQRYSLGRDEMTNRIITAIKNPFTTILGHPTGRLLLERDAYQVDIDQILEAAKERGTWIECNGNPKRLDLSAENMWKAKKLKIPLVITPDAHSIAQLDLTKYGVSQARKAGILPNEVLNTLSYADFMKELENRRKSQVAL